MLFMYKPPDARLLFGWGVIKTARHSQILFAFIFYPPLNNKNNNNNIFLNNRPQIVAYVTMRLFNCGKTSGQFIRNRSLYMCGVCM